VLAAAAVGLRPIGYCSLRMFMSWAYATGLTLPSSEPVSLMSDAFASFCCCLNHTPFYFEHNACKSVSYMVSVMVLTPCMYTL